MIPRSRAAVALATSRAAAVGALLAVTVSTGVGAAVRSEPGPPRGTVDAATQSVQRVLDAHQCSTSGFAPGTVPTSALVRTAAGTLRSVPFDVGWAVFTGERPGLLVAVCLGEPRGTVRGG